MPALILASTSRYRRELLERLALPFTAMAPDCDEDAYKQRGLAAAELSQLLAYEKAASIARRHPGAFVLGSDQVVEVDGVVLGKPGTPERAMAQLERACGRTQRLCTAFSLLGPSSRDDHLDVHTLHMRALSASEIARYVAADAPLDCAGSYKIEGRGIALFERIEGDDFTAITGLPLIALVSCLRARGFAVP